MACYPDFDGFSGSAWSNAYAMGFNNSWPTRDKVTSGPTTIDAETYNSSLHRPPPESSPENTLSRQEDRSWHPNNNTRFEPSRAWKETHVPRPPQTDCNAQRSASSRRLRGLGSSYRPHYDSDGSRYGNSRFRDQNGKGSTYIPPLVGGSPLRLNNGTHAAGSTYRPTNDGLRSRGWDSYLPARSRSRSRSLSRSRSRSRSARCRTPLHRSRSSSSPPYSPASLRSRSRSRSGGHRQSRTPLPFQTSSPICKTRPSYSQSRSRSRRSSRSRPRTPDQRCPDVPPLDNRSLQERSFSNHDDSSQSLKDTPNVATKETATGSILRASVTSLHSSAASSRASDNKLGASSPISPANDNTAVSDQGMLTGTQSDEREQTTVKPQSETKCVEPAALIVSNASAIFEQSKELGKRVGCGKTDTAGKQPSDVPKSAGDSILAEADKQLSPDLSLSTTASVQNVVLKPTSSEVPDLREARSAFHALRIIVMTRLLEVSDESRERRIDEVLQANLSLTPHAEADHHRTAEDVVHEVMFRPRWDSRMEVFSRIKDCLGNCIEARRALISSKAERLCQEYVVRNEEWHSYCASLDEQARQATAAIELVPPQQPGRTTRRSAAYLGLGNIIYSDLEMEQVIASIGYNEATDPILLAKRNMATIPDMISVTNGAVDYTFDSDNLLVDDPHEHFATHTGIYDWTEEEKAIMLEHYGNTPKQFGLIADHLPYKTAEQCVQYYYLHKKKLVNFRKAVNKRKRRGGRMGKGKANALLTDIRQHDAEVKGGAVTPEPVVISSGRRGRKKTRAATLQDDACTSTATSTPEPELDGSKRKANEISSPRSVSMDTDDGKKARVNEANKEDDRSEWDQDDQDTFIRLLGQYGMDFSRISAMLPNQTVEDVQLFYNTHLLSLNLASIVSKAAFKNGPFSSQTLD